MRFSIRFHTPFRVASGHAADGANTTIDRAVPLPASSLKGVMRSAARDLLGLDARWVVAVYGDERHWQPSPWNWSDGSAITRTAADRAGATPEVRTRARIQIDPSTSAVVEGALAIAEEILAYQAEFTVTRSAWIPPHLRAAHESVLLASARAVTALGGDRRRGLGWVTITPIDPPWPTEPQLTTHIDRLIGALSTLPDPELAHPSADSEMPG